MADELKSVLELCFKLKGLSEFKNMETPIKFDSDTFKGGVQATCPSFDSGKARGEVKAIKLLPSYKYKIQ